MDITKEEFEGVINVATSSQMQVYGKVRPSLSEASERCAEEIFGGMTTTDFQIETEAKAFVCIDAFLSVLRQLDLVLTPTGFGVVANNTTSPASKERVNALEQQLLLERERRFGRLLQLLPKVNGWGDTTAATRCIRTLYYDIHFYEQTAGKAADYAAWREAQLPIAEADTMLRRKISDAQMDTLLSAVRHATITAEQLGAIVLIQKITALHIARSPMVEERVRNLIVYMEQDGHSFSEYLNSREYKTNHYERFQNKKHSPGYCFVG